MNNIFRRIFTFVLALTLLFSATVPVFAADGEDEEYISDLRIIYAEDFEEASDILENSDLEGYKLLAANLNENTGKIGVFLVYKPTTDIEDAITDISVMQMNGGYQEGNYQAMIKQSYNEYLEFGENYLVAIDYFNKAYDAGNYLAKIAHRQLNFYNVVTEEIDEIPSFEGERIGDIFYNGIDVGDLATMFMEGNSYALANIRSLLAMGVSYNEDGKTYLEKVADEAAKYNADNSVYDDEDFDSLAAMIATELSSINNMLKELEANEPDMNWDDEEVSDLELQFIDVKFVATMFKEVAYTADKTLYDFALAYTYNENDYTALYPLVAALNEGQIAMTKVAHYYDVVRYSMTLETNEDIEAALAEAEEEYGDYPFNVYEGVDRTIYRDTFALTSAAYRADAFTEEGLMAALFQGGEDTTNMVFGGIGAAGAAIFAAGFITHAYHRLPAWMYSLRYSSLRSETFKKVAENSTFDISNLGSGTTMEKALVHYKEAFTAEGIDLPSDIDFMSDEKQYFTLEKIFRKNPVLQTQTDFDDFRLQMYKRCVSESEEFRNANEAIYGVRHQMSSTTAKFVYGAYIVGGLMMLTSAIKLGIDIYNYYHPEYTDIPTAMVDLIDTKDGDRYIKYDVVLEAEYNEDGGYSAADLNAFSAARWNALYYTKSYEAGKPLLADSFVVSNNNNTPAKDYAPVHRFGEVVSYNLNKYNFNDDYTIYLSVKQSQNQKAAVADVPEIVGSVFSTGYLVLAGGVGALVGVGGVIGTQAIIKRKKQTVNSEAEATEQA